MSICDQCINVVRRRVVACEPVYVLGWRSYVEKLDVFMVANVRTHRTLGRDHLRYPTIWHSRMCQQLQAPVVHEWTSCYNDEIRTRSTEANATFNFAGYGLVRMIICDNDDNDDPSMRENGCSERLQHSSSPTECGDTGKPVL